jgi:soluble lytic murein transglycosylase-like protein
LSLFVHYPSICQGNLASPHFQQLTSWPSSNWWPAISDRKFSLKSGHDPAEITYMFFQITDLYFPAWDGIATPGEIGRPGDVPVPAGQQLRRWGALLALAGLALPGFSSGGLTDGRPAAIPVVGASLTEDGADPAGLPGGELGDDPRVRDAAAPWEAGLVEADGKPLPAAPPPGPVPVEGIPLPAVAATAPPTPPAAPAPKASPAPGETARAVPNQSVAPPPGPANDLVPADREYLRPILVRYAQENGLPADLVMALAWVESSWRRATVSDAGAVGVMQLMPNTVEFVCRRLLGLRTNLDPRNPTSNVRMGAKYLRHLLDQNRGSVRQALIAYNQGPTSLRMYGSYNVAERYADRVLALRSQFRSA